ncbi:hypothetical protein KKE18_03115 [Patescibacteria group bacterium]|nr:hypothetical protein [Patescibacteria group bacterium]MBU0922771.1 hypothetical protein [Patescibacteria group bacterium]MBU1844917.1 hypothetical protein [Patescibacteria group bacterium]
MHKLPKKPVNKECFSLILLFIFFFLALGFFVSKAKAQIPNPPVPCDETRNDEFHSLRPYQASPCDDKADTALFCGNDLIVADTITVTKNQATSCESLSSGKEKCSFTTSNSKNIRIDLSSADFPILGNTESVVNIDKDADDSGFDDVGKTNEYVSWYLNGTINRAEYEFLNPSEKQDISKLIDFSGPINKLLPWEQQVAYRINTIKQTGATRHDQIIACTVAGVPVPCYHQGLLEIIDTKHRLSDWEGKITNLPTLPGTWNERVPPQRKDFENFLNYWEAYREWRGNSCGQFTIPIINKRVLLCSPIDNPLRPNYWADLFPYVPFSSTEDQLGFVETQTLTAYSPSEDVTLKEVLFDNQEPAELFFAHTEEVAELASILQKTFAPQGAENNLSFSGVSPTEYCDLVNVRTNEGDDLFAGEIGGVLSYTAEFTCELEPGASNACESAGGECINTPSCIRVGKGTVNGGSGCNTVNETCCAREEPLSGQECTKEIYANLSVITKTPKVNEIWARTVAGPSSIFKRIFPKIGEGGAILGLLDIPGATNVTYSGDGLVYAGNPGNERSGESAELYFPHVGGVSEYFLKGIQTILRPKGFGEQILSGQPGTESPVQECNQDISNSAIPSKYLGAFKENFIRMARDWSEKTECQGLENTMADECYNDVVKRSVDKGVNPAFTLTIWLNETGASNYCESGSTAQDFGIRIPSIFQNFGEQLDHFLGLPFSGTYVSCSNEAGWDNRIHAFLSRFRSGGCDPTDSEGNIYYNHIKETTWPWVSNCSNLPSWPTDTSCP